MRTRIALAILALLPIVAIVSVIQRFDGDSHGVTVDIDLDDHAVVHRHANSTVQVHRIFDAQDGGELVVHVADADLDIMTHADQSASVDVEATIEGEVVESSLETLGLRVAMENNRFTIFQDHHRRHDDLCDLRLRIRIPNTYNVEAHTTDGDVSLMPLQGDVAVRTSDGDIRFRTLVGQSLRLQSSDGDITGSAAEGDRVILQTADGDIRFETLVGRELTVRTSDGDISASSVEGDGTVSTSDGDVRVRTLIGQQLVLRTSDGDIHTNHVEVAGLELRTSDGSLSARLLSGDLNASTSSGDIQVNLENHQVGSARLYTTDGNIVVQAPRQRGTHVKLEGESVLVDDMAGFDGRQSDQRVEGTFGDGSLVLEARAQNGRVILRK